MNGREVFLFFIAVAAKQARLQLSLALPSSYFVSLGSFKVLWTH